MKTASFFTYSGPGRISIARYAPHNAPPGSREFSALAPGPWFNTLGFEQYRTLYFAQLANLDPQRIYEDLHKLAGRGVEPVLLCYERPPFTASNWCHRRMFAEWLVGKLGINVPEVDIANARAPFDVQPPWPRR